MGVFDSFYDDESECPQCHAKIAGGWQTKRLQSFLASWRKGDFLQYHKYELIPEKERRSKYGERLFAPTLRRTNEYRSDAPLLFNGKVPVHASCRNCKTWLEAYAKIVGGYFKGIVEIEADVEAKELVVISPTAKALREEFESRLSHLQESCKHEKARWTNVDEAQDHPEERQLVCPNCDKILEKQRPPTPNLRFPHRDS